MSRNRKTSSGSTWRTFRWPLALGLASSAGLLSALLGDGMLDIASWLLLGGLLGVMMVAYVQGDR